VKPDPRHIPCYRATLPHAERLLPYLRTIDANHWYTNRGELVMAFEARLSALLRGMARAVSAASGTAALESAILATAGRATPERPFALLPAYTFAATALAVERCGYTPYLVDVDDEDWSLRAERLVDHPQLSRAGVVVPVAPYGRAIAQGEWVTFSTNASVPVVIDAAAAFESLVARPENFTGAVPVVVSFHATKVLSTGEGGAVFWSDAEGLLRVLRAQNFGILGERECKASGANGRMSEYHAAVGLAALDGWNDVDRANRETVELYRRSAAARHIEERLHVAPRVASNYALVDAGSPAAADELTAALKAEGIESRRWYGRGLHREAYFRDVPRDRLPVTERIAPVLIGLPIYPGIEERDVDRIVATAARATVVLERGT
jgi:dTDP-4-amino-4,6-dideoxygalactose transaminase